ncbi:MAG: type IA DNA topoisomerase, partial [Peptostreptococcaceae bacterium]|nr:type IA DNA topoisomerase [Peptostreptococcaceae bacterium]
RDVGYIESKGKNLVCTELGIMLVETFPVKELFDLEYTGRLEKTLSDIERKKFNKQDFLDLIIEFTKKSVSDVKNDIIFGSNVVLPDTVEIIGKCPECGNPIIETEKAFGCSNWKNGCKFTVWKNDKFIESFGKKINADVVRILLEKGRVGFRGLLSKKGNKFSAYFKYVKDTEKGNYSWSMEFIDENKIN